MCEEKDAALQNKDAEINRLKEELRKVQVDHQQQGPDQVTTSCGFMLNILAAICCYFPLQFTWRHGPDMPFEMRAPIQSAVVHEMLYVSGGYSNPSHRKIVMKYDIHSGEWAVLSRYKKSAFAMAAIKNQLVLVGGIDCGNASKKLSVWKDDCKW